MLFKWNICVTKLTEENAWFHSKSYLNYCKHLVSLHTQSRGWLGPQFLNAFRVKYRVYFEHFLIQMWKTMMKKVMNDWTLNAMENISWFIHKLFASSQKGGKNWGTFKTLLWPFFCLKRFCLFNFLMWPKIFFSFKLTIYKHIASIHDIIRTSSYILKHYKVNGYFPKTKGIRHNFFFQKLASFIEGARVHMVVY